MLVAIQRDETAVTQYAYEFVRARMRRKPACVLGLATGGTPLRLYQAMVEGYRRGELDFSLVHTFNLDEYIGLEANHPQSYHFFMKTHLFDQVNVQPAHVHFLSGLPDDIETHCAQYEQLIREVGGIDVQVLGIGRDGHIGFNEPTSSLCSRTRDKVLAPETIKDNQRYFAHEEDVPRWALTMGVGTILEAREILMLATGSAKAGAIAAMIEGPVTAMCTASALQLHPRVTVVCDEGAASRLEQADYYRWIARNEAGIHEALRRKR